jgi:hypothetical protein
MTKAAMALTELAEKGPDVDVLRQMIQFVAPRLMDMNVEQLCGAGYDVKSAERTNSRNGYRDRTWDTRAGTIDLKLPRLRSGSYFPPFLEPPRTAKKVLATVIQEAYVQGVSTRSVGNLVKALGMSGISKSQVLRLCTEIDERVSQFLNRPIEGDWPYRWIDAIDVKVREAGRIVSVAVIIAVGVNTDGVREVLGMAVGPSEAKPFWITFLRTLTRRGLRGVNRETHGRGRRRCAGFHGVSPNLHCGHHSLASEIVPSDAAAVEQAAISARFSPPVSAFAGMRSSADRRAAIGARDRSSSRQCRHRAGCMPARATRRRDLPRHATRTPPQPDSRRHRHILR